MYKSSTFPLVLAIEASYEVGHRLVGTTGLHLEVGRVLAFTFLASEEPLISGICLSPFHCPVRPPRVNALYECFLSIRLLLLTGQMFSIEIGQVIWH